MEVVLLLLVVLAPWAFGAVEPIVELILYIGVALLCVLWGMRWLADGCLTWKRCPVTLCLLGLFLFGLWQVIPLPRTFLGAIAPGTLRTYEQLLPFEAELLPDGQPVPDAPTTPGSTLSLYPGATQRQLDHFLAVLLVFALVRNNVASAGAVRRLSIACLANGAALSFFALLQHFSSRPEQLYWTWTSPGAVFGPFICRNHFPFYTNMCLGLGIGLLLTRPSFRGGQPLRADEDAAPSGRHSQKGRGHRSANRSGVGSGSWADVLHDHQALWICSALALILVANVLSLSRAGVLALLPAAILCLFIWLHGSPRVSGLGVAAVVLSAVFGVLVWFGLGRVEERFASLFKNETTWESRERIWASALMAARDFPVWGSGFGTFAYIEPLHRTDAEETAVVWDHAHNEYLEALVEGGLIRLALSLLALALVFRLGWRAVLRRRDQPDGALALGGLFALTTVATHSVVDFGLHLPAITLLTAVIAAQLCTLGSSPETTDAAESDRPRRLRLRGVAPVLGLLVVGGTGLLLAHEGWRVFLVHRYYVAAMILGQRTGPDTHDTQRAFLEHCAALVPESALVEQELASIHLANYSAGIALVDRTRTAADVVGLVAALASATAGATVGGMGLPNAAAWVSDVAFGELEAAEERNRWEKEQLGAALRHYLQARDRCPLLAMPQMRIGFYASSLEKADPRRAYFERAKFLVPADAELWYQCGVQESLDDQREQACANWRRSLELSDRYLAPILEHVSQAPDDVDLINQVLPDDPAIWIAAGFRLFPGTEGADKRRPFAVKALQLADTRPDSGSPKDFHTRGLIHGALEQWEEAIAAYRAALAQQPDHVNWRFELAQMLCARGRLEEARAELVTVLARQPGHAAARKLFEAVTLERAKKT